MKRLAGVMMLLGLSFGISKVHAANVTMNVQLSTNTAPGALVRGTISAAGQTVSKFGTTNASGFVSLPFLINIATAAPTVPAVYHLKARGLSLSGQRLTGSQTGAFTIVVSTPTNILNLFLPMQ